MRSRRWAEVVDVSEGASPRWQRRDVGKAVFGRDDRITFTDGTAISLRRAAYIPSLRLVNTVLDRLDAKQSAVGSPNPKASIAHRANIV